MVSILELVVFVGDDVDDGDIVIMDNKSTDRIHSIHCQFHIHTIN